MTDRLEVIICGRKLGTASGWDGESEFLWFEDFVPADHIPLTACESLYVDYGNGFIGANCSHETGKLLDGQDLPSFLTPLPRVIAS